LVVEVAEAGVVPAEVVLAGVVPIVFVVPFC